MADGVITVKLKLDWQDRMAFDRDLSNMAFRVGYAISWHLNRYSGDTYVGRKTIAEKLGVTVKSVDRAIKELEAKGHLEVTHSRGRSNSNNYRPAFPQKATQMSPFPTSGHLEKTTTESPFLSGEKATSSDEKGDKSDDKRRHGCPPNPYIIQNLTLKRDSGVQSRPQPNTEPAAPPLAFRKEAGIGNASAKRDDQDAGNRVAELLAPGNAELGWLMALSLDGKQFEYLKYRVRSRSINATDLAAARLAYQKINAKGVALEQMPRPDDIWRQSA